MPERITVAACERIIKSTQAHCSDAVRTAGSESPNSPNFDALALVVAQQNNLIGSIALLVGILVAILGVGWGYLIKKQAEETARQSAEEWMQRNAGDLIAQFSPPLSAAPTSSGLEVLSPAQQAEQLELEGENPAG